ncbi:hypothetical protein [Pseudotabrizicola sp. L79]|uniref:hypothetical protein n=1 Tax=Pseudotabrizicola sp. L79 TaxID=3118402 RepID=UPI002F928B37
MIEQFTDVGHVVIDDERMRLVGTAPSVNGVYAFVFDGQVQYIGAADRKIGGLHQRLCSCLRRARHISYSNRKDGLPGTTSALRNAIRCHLEANETVNVWVVTIDKMPDRDVAGFKRRAILALCPPLNKAHITPIVNF